MQKKSSLLLIFLGLLMIVVIYFFPQNTKYLSLLALLVSLIGVVNLLIEKKKNDMRNMFSHCENLTSLDVSNFDTSNITNFEGMFSHCENLTTLDLSDFDTSNVNTKH